MQWKETGTCTDELWISYNANLNEASVALYLATNMASKLGQLLGLVACRSNFLGAARHIAFCIAFLPRQKHDDHYVIRTIGSP